MTHHGLKEPFEEPKHTPESTQIIEAPKQGRFIHNIHIRHTKPFGVLDNRLSDADWRTWFMVQNDPTHSVQQKMRTVGAGKQTYHTELVPLSTTYDDKSTENTKIAQFAKANHPTISAHSR